MAIKKPTEPLPGASIVLAVLSIGIVALIVYRCSHTVRLDDPDRVVPVERWPDMRIDINRASAAELSLLPGIGPSIAENIIEDRIANGAFQSIDELQRVRLIGPIIVERLRPYAVVGEVERDG